MIMERNVLEMLSWPLLKRNGKICLIPFMFIFLLLSLYTSVIIYMYNPEFADMLNDYQEALPQVMAAVGMTGIAQNLLEWIQIYLYGFIMLLFPLIFIIIAVNKLLMSEIDKRTMAGLLATPNSRGKIIFTQVISLYLWLTLLMVCVTFLGFLCCQGIFPGELDIKGYLLLNFGTLMLWFAIAGIAFFTACVSKESKYYYAFGAGLPILFFLLDMVSRMGEELDFMRYFTLYSLFSGDEIVANQPGAMVACLILGAVGLILSAVGCVYFTRRDLSL